MARIRLIAVFWMLTGISQAFAQGREPRLAHVNNLSFGVNAGELGYDPWLGVEVSSRAFWKDHFKLTARASLVWLEAHKIQTDHWITFKNYGLGMRYYTQLIERARFYSEAGIAGLHLNKDISSRKFSPGSYALLGVEIFVENTDDYNISYFFGGGYQQAKGVANKMEPNATYGKGFLFTNGFRFYF